MLNFDKLKKFLSYNQIELHGFFKKHVEKEQKEYLEKFKQDKNNETKIKIKVRRMELYKDFGDITIVNKFTNNRHQDLANFRLYFEWLNIRFSITGYKDCIIVDVGCSTRLYNSLIPRYVLRPLLDVIDYSRLGKLTPNNYVIIEKLTVQQFVNKYELEIRKNRVILNFTDVLYYITPYDLIQIYKEFQYGIVGVATLHLFNDIATTKSLLDLGYVETDEEKHYMKVVGNESTYEHNAYYQPLLKNDIYVIKGIEYNIVLLKKASVNLQKTVYIRVEIIKTRKQQFSSSFMLPEEEKIKIEVDEKKSAYYKIIDSTVLDYKNEMKLKYQDMLNTNVISQIRIRIRVPLPETEMFGLIKQSIINLSIYDRSL